MEPLEGKVTGTQRPEDTSTKRRRVAELARRNPDMVFTSLAHFIDVRWLHKAYESTRKDGAPGVDGQVAEEYAKNLEGNLQSLLNRFRSGAYRAPPVRRVHIPKGDGSKTRPIGIPTFEDKVLQRAVVLLLEAIYEQDFLDCSYGFRPGRSAHQAIGHLWRILGDMRGAWVVEVDIKSFFDCVDHSHLRALLDQRVRDGVLRRTIDKWLKAGVEEAGRLTHPVDGTPQGGVISPLLANVYLHHVLDVWFASVVRPRLANRAELIRYADDFVIACADKGDAERIMAVLPKRFGKYGLTLHPEKTRLVEFLPPTRQRRDGSSEGPGPRPPTFDLLGFTHYWGVSRRGNWVVKRRTAASRFRRALKAMNTWCRRNRHQRAKQQHATLCRKVRGHCNYYGISGNWQALNNFKRKVERIWRVWLGRRSQRARMTWARFKRLLERYPLPKPRITARC